MNVKYFIIIYLNWSITQVISVDPCSTFGGHVSLSGWIGSRKEMCPVTVESVQTCDLYLLRNWYTIDNGLLLNHCPMTGNCGSAYPAWMNGSYPSVSEGEVELNACVKRDGDCCKDQVKIMVKNCTNFLVYHLRPLKECASTYCVESTFSCDAPTTTTTTTTTKTTTSDTRISTTSILSLTTAESSSSKEENWKIPVIVSCSVGGAIIGAVSVACGYHVYKSLQHKISAEKPPPSYDMVVEYPSNPKPQTIA